MPKIRLLPALPNAQPVVIEGRREEMRHILRLLASQMPIQVEHADRGTDVAPQHRCAQTRPCGVRDTN